MTKLENAIKKLHWLQFNFPWQDSPENDADKMFNAIHKYTGDAIELLESQQWISVRDRLPEESGEYLVFCKIGYQNVLNYSTRHKAFNALDTEEKAVHAIEVTHWMPLPEPPKER